MGRVFDTYAHREYIHAASNYSAFDYAITVAKTGGIVTPTPVVAVTPALIDTSYTFYNQMLNSNPVNYQSAQFELRGSSSYAFSVDTLRILVLESTLTNPLTNANVSRFSVTDYKDVALANEHAFFHFTIPLWTVASGILSVWLSCWESGSAVVLGSATMCVQVGT